MVVLLGTRVFAPVGLAFGEVVGLFGEVGVQEQLEVLVGANMVQRVLSHW